MSDFSTLEPSTPSLWQTSPAGNTSVPTASSYGADGAANTNAPLAKLGPKASVSPANSNQISAGAVAAILGMGDYVDGAESSAPSGGGLPREVLDRAGFEFDHDGGYRYRITPEGNFEIVDAPGGKGIGCELTPAGEFASAWQTLSGYIVAMGPVSAPSKSPPSKSPPATGAPSGGGPTNGQPTGPSPGPRQPSGGVPSTTPPVSGPNPSAPGSGGGRGGSQLGAGEFLSQRDNEFDDEGCTENNQCTPTSATMAILGRMSLDAFYERAHTLLADKGEGRSLEAICASQPEDLVIEWMYLNDPTHHDSAVRGSSDNVMKAIEAWTGQDATSEWTEGSVREQVESVALPGVCGTDLTGSGHTVELIERNAQGIVINDPYGACRSVDQYLRHGEAGAPPPEHRWSRRPDLAAVDSEAAPREDWGRANFYTWAEVESFRIGRWVVGAE